MKKESSTIQIGLRLEKELIERLEFFAGRKKLDKMMIIKQAIAAYVGDMEDAFEDTAVEDYICLRISEQELKEHIGLKEIPADIKEARKETIKLITKERMKR